MKQKVINAVKRAILAIHNATRPAEVAPTSVAEVLADFEKKIQGLLGVRDAKQKSIAFNEQSIRNLVAQNQRSDAEANRANAIADKLKALVS